MKNRLIFIFIVFIVISCTSARQVHKLYLGKPLPEIEAKLGAPVTIIEKNDSKIYVFEELKELKSTEISQGKLTLDPIVTPPVKKTRRYFLTVKDNIVVKTRLEEEYNR